jgi:hypothetical protein
MDVKHASIEIEENLLAPPPNILYKRAMKRRGRSPKPAASNPARQQLGMLDRSSEYMRSYGANYRLYFWKFRHRILRNINEHAAALDDHGIRRHLHIFIIVVEARAAIELEAMQRANQVISVQSALPERTTGMRAGTRDAVQLTVDVAYGISYIAGFNFGDFTRWKLRKRLYFDQWHTTLQ